MMTVLRKPIFLFWSLFLGNLCFAAGYPTISNVMGTHDDEVGEMVKEFKEQVILIHSVLKTSDPRAKVQHDSQANIGGQNLQVKAILLGQGEDLYLKGRITFTMLQNFRQMINSQILNPALGLYYGDADGDGAIEEGLLTTLSNKYDEFFGYEETAGSGVWKPLPSAQRVNYQLSHPTTGIKYPGAYEYAKNLACNPDTNPQHVKAADPMVLKSVSDNPNSVFYPTGQSVTKAFGKPCNDHNQCFSGVCNKPEQWNPSSTGKCAMTTKCYPPLSVGSNCGLNNPICNNPGKCREVNRNIASIGSCKALGTSCSSASQCCSEKCEASKCTQSFKCENCATFGQMPSQAIDANDKSRPCCPGLITDPSKEGGRCQRFVPPFYLDLEHYQGSTLKRIIRWVSDLIIPSARAQANICNQANNPRSGDSVTCPTNTQWDPQNCTCMCSGAACDPTSTNFSCPPNFNLSTGAGVGASCIPIAGEFQNEAQATPTPSAPFNADMQTTVNDGDNFRRVQTDALNAVKMLGQNTSSNMEARKTDPKKCHFNTFADYWLRLDPKSRRAELALAAFEFVNGAGIENLNSAQNAQPSNQQLWIKDPWKLYQGKGINENTHIWAKKIHENRIWLKQNTALLDVNETCNCIAFNGGDISKYPDKASIWNSGIGQCQIHNPQGSGNGNGNIAANTGADGDNKTHAQTNDDSTGIKYLQYMVDYLAQQITLWSQYSARQRELEVSFGELAMALRNNNFNVVRMSETKIGEYELKRLNGVLVAIVAVVAIVIVTIATWGAGTVALAAIYMTVWTLTLGVMIATALIPSGVMTEEDQIYLQWSMDALKSISSYYQYDDLKQPIEIGDISRRGGWSSCAAIYQCQKVEVYWRWPETGQFANLANSNCNGTFYAPQSSCLTSFSFIETQGWLGNKPGYLIDPFMPYGFTQNDIALDARHKQKVVEGFHRGFSELMRKINNDEYKWLKGGRYKVGNGWDQDQYIMNDIWIAFAPIYSRSTRNLKYQDYLTKLKAKAKAFAGPKEQGGYDFFSTSEDLEDWANYVIEYHFIWPKLSYSDRIMYDVPGQIPYFELLAYFTDQQADHVDSMVTSMAGNMNLYNQQLTALMGPDAYQYQQGNIQGTVNLPNNGKPNTRTAPNHPKIQFGGMTLSARTNLAGGGAQGLSSGDSLSASNVNSATIGQRKARLQKQNLALLKQYKDQVGNSAVGRRVLGARNQFLSRFAPSSLARRFSGGSGLNQSQLENSFDNGKSLATAGSQNEEKKNSDQKNKGQKFSDQFQQNGGGRVGRQNGLNGFNFGYDSGSSGSRGNGSVNDSYVDPNSGLDHAEIKNMLKDVDKKYLKRDSDSLWQIVTKAYVRSYHRVLIRKKSKQSAGEGAPKLRLPASKKNKKRPNALDLSRPMSLE